MALTRPNTVVADPQVPANLAFVSGMNEVRVALDYESKEVLVEIRDLLFQILVSLGGR